MEFIDHTGHIYSLKDWQNEPIGYEYEIGNYVDWFTSDTTSHKLSIDRYYIKPVRIIVNSNDHISVKLKNDIKDDTHFWLLSSRYIQDCIENNNNIFDPLNIEESEFCNELYTYDLTVIDNVEVEGRESTVSVATFYVVTLSQEETTWLTNILIEIYNYDNDSSIWCPYTIGAEFHMEDSELIINGKNMGINIPKDMMKSIYFTDVKSDNIDEEEYSHKLKELLLNYMHIKGECGNYESAKDSLDWFGYGNHITIRGLNQTDNQFLEQYIQDNFDTLSDNLWSWQHFRKASAYSIWMDIDRYTEVLDKQYWTEELIGEGKPISENLFDKMVYDKFDEQDIKFWRPYYNWRLEDMYIKMSMVEYYWKKYFLPIMTTISSSMKQHCWMNDIKYIVSPSIHVTETPTWIGSTNTSVRFQGSDIVYIYNQESYFDECYNEFSNSETLGKTTENPTIYINDICAKVPIWFLSNEDEDFFDVTLVLTKEGKKIYSSSFSFFQRKDDVAYKNFVMIPKSLVKSFNMTYWIDKKYRLSVNCNGNWYYYDFMLKAPEFQLKVGTLEYKYFNYTEVKELKPGEEGYRDPNDPEFDGLTESEKANINLYTTEKSLFSQVKSIEDDSVNFNSYMYLPGLAEVNDIRFFDKLKYMIDNASSDNSDSDSNNASTNTMNNFCNYIASKCYIYNLGVKNSQVVYKKGNSVIPIFMFNNGLDIPDNQGYSLSKFYVDVLFDVDSNNEYYAKIRLNLNDLSTTKPNECVNLHEYTISNNDLIMMKKDIGLGDPAYNKQGNIDWDATSDKWKLFYIDEHLRHKSTVTIRLATTGEIKLPNGRTYEFGGYTLSGVPRIYQDIAIPIWNPNSDSVCNMECNCPWKSECKFRGDNLKTDYDSTPRLDEVDMNMKQEITSENVKKSIDSLINSMRQTVSTSNNKKYLNRMHIYDLYLYKMNDVEKRKRLGLNISKISKLKYNSKIYDTKWYSPNHWEQPSELVELYRMFFNDDGTEKFTIGDDNTFNYDFYLMHDDTNWFAVLISQDTEDKLIGDMDLDPHDKIEYCPDDETKIVMKKYRSSDAFLINRMVLEEKYPVNHFKEDDLIFATIDNVKFPFILDKTTKWSVKNLSLLNKNKPSIISNSNAMILSLYDEASKNVSGYYNIDVRYSIEGNVDHQQKKHTRILIEK